MALKNGLGSWFFVCSVINHGHLKILILATDCKTEFWKLKLLLCGIQQLFHYCLILQNCMNYFVNINIYIQSRCAVWNI